MNTFIIPFQLSPVETWKSVRKAMPKFSKVACRLMPSHGFSSLQTERGRGGQPVHPQHPKLPPLSILSDSYNPQQCMWIVPSPQMGQVRLKEVLH